MGEGTGGVMGGGIGGGMSGCGIGGDMAGGMPSCAAGRCSKWYSWCSAAPPHLGWVEGYGIPLWCRCRTDDRYVALLLAPQLCLQHSP